MLMLIYKLASFDWMGNIFELIPYFLNGVLLQSALNVLQTWYNILHTFHKTQKKTQPVNLKQIQTADPDINYLIPTDLSLSTVIVAA